jgi:hypothetical protein
MISAAGKTRRLPITNLRPLNLLLMFAGIVSTFQFRGADAIVSGVSASQPPPLELEIGHSARQPRARP